MIPFRFLFSSFVFLLSEYLSRVSFFCFVLFCFIFFRFPFFGLSLSSLVSFFLCGLTLFLPKQGNQIIQDHQGELVLHTISPTGTETEYPFPSQSDQKDYFKVQVPFQAVGTFWCMVRFNNVPIQSKNAKILVKK